MASKYYPFMIEMLDYFGQAFDIKIVNLTILNLFVCVFNADSHAPNFP